MKIRVIIATVAVAVIALLTAACPGNVAHTYRSFESAADRGASCSELFDQRGRYTDAGTVAKIDEILNRIGCTSRDASRTDR